MNYIIQKLSGGVILGWCVYVITAEVLAEMERDTAKGWLHLAKIGIGAVSCFFIYWSLLPEKRRDAGSFAAYWGAIGSYRLGVASGFFQGEPVLVKIAQNSVKKRTATITAAVQFVLSCLESLTFFFFS